MPWISTQVHATSQLADLGIRASRAGHVATIAAGALLQPPPAGTKEDPGVKLLRELDLLDPTLADISAELAKVESDRNSIPASGLFPNVADAVKQLDRRFNVHHFV